MFVVPTLYEVDCETPLRDRPFSVDDNGDFVDASYQIFFTNTADWATVNANTGIRTGAAEFYELCLKLELRYNNGDASVSTAVDSKFYTFEITGIADGTTQVSTIISTAELSASSSGNALSNTALTVDILAAGALEQGDLTIEVLSEDVEFGAPIEFQFEIDTPGYTIENVLDFVVLYEDELAYALQENLVTQEDISNGKRITAYLPEFVFDVVDGDSVEIGFSIEWSYEAPANRALRGEDRKLAEDDSVTGSTKVKVDVKLAGKNASAGVTSTTMWLNAGAMLAGMAFVL